MTLSELTSQVNAVSTMLLNGEIPLETARTYSGMVGSTARLLSTEVRKAQMQKNSPQLALHSDNLFEDEDATA